MSARPLGELLLRPTSLSRISCAQNFRQAASPSWSTHRVISTSNPTKAAESQPKEAPSSNTPPQSEAQASADRTSEAIDNLFNSMPGRAMSRGPPTAYKRSSQEETTNRARNIFGSNFSNAKAGSGFQRRGLDFDSMSMDGLPLTLPNQPTTIMPLAPEKENFPRLNPAFGRTVDLKPEQGRDLVRGISMLGSMMARNSVKYDFNKQRFHERPGLKRKRLNSERWRARFKVGFQQVTGRVSELTRKGW